MGKKNKRQKTKEVETEEEGVNASSTGRTGDEVGESSPRIAPRKRGRPRKIAAEKKEEEDDDEGEMGGVGKKKKKKDEQQVNEEEEEDSTRSRARRKSTPRKST